MGMLKFEVPSTLPIEDAKKRVEALLGYWNRKYGITSSWNGLKAQMKGKAVGVTIDGNLEVQSSRIAGEASDPGMLLRGQAQKYLTRKFAEYLDANRSLDEIQRSED
ncbi:MAG: polyhydroxyalkanoic acid system family protein [Myxococcaceae bacterium]|nr:polyhydroxyalkanoic acid system family protein [Myxococcaceae bacterium]